jgi:hypothetical protein
MARPGFLFPFALIDALQDQPSDIVGGCLRLHALVARKASGSRVRGAKTWASSTWLQVTGLEQTKLFPALEAAGVAIWDGDDLVLAECDEHGQKVYDTRRWTAANATAVRLARQEENRTEHSTVDLTENSTEGGNKKRQLPLPLKENKKGKEAEGSARARETPPPPSFSSGKVDTADLLAEFALGNSPKATREWAGVLNKIAMVRSLDEARAFLRWAIRICERQGVRVEFSRHVKLLAEEWRNRRPELWKERA